MTRRDLASDWVARFQMTPARAQSCVDELYRDFCAALAAGGEVQLRGIGTWKTAVRKNRRRGIRMHPSGALVRAANSMLPQSKNAAVSSLPLSKRPSARIPLLVAQLFGKWPSRQFLKIVGQIAGSDSSGLLRLLEEMLRCRMSYDPGFPVPFVEFLKEHLR